MMVKQPSDGGEDCQSPPSSSAGTVTIKHEIKDHEVPFIEAYKVVFCVASLTGLHLVARDDTGVYRLRKWKLFPTVLSLYHATHGLVVVSWMFMFENISYYKKIMLLPILFGCIFCFYVYILFISKFRDFIKYFTALETNGVTMKKNAFIQLFIIIGIAAYSFVYTTCLSLASLLPQENILSFQGIILVTSFVPSFIDLYSFSFVEALIVDVTKLARRIKGIELWTTGSVRQVAQEWLRLSQLFHKHNQISQYLLHIRLLLLMVQTMTFTFSLVVVRPSASCLHLLLPTLVPLTELTIRFICLCLAGESLLNTYNNVLDGMRAAVCWGSTAGDGGREHEDPNKQGAAAVVGSRRQEDLNKQSTAVDGCRGQEDLNKQGVAVVGGRGQVEDLSKQVAAALDGSTGQKDSKQVTAEYEGREPNFSQQAPVYRPLHNLLSRMEARPFTFQIWGMDKLSGRTFVQCIGLVLTYVVVLLQLRPTQDHLSPQHCNNTLF